MTNNQLIIIGIIVVGFIGLRLLKRLKQISVAKAKLLLSEGAVMVDVRTPGEFSSGHIKGAKNIPLNNLANISKKATKDKDIIVYCQSGSRSSSAASQLKSMGYEKVHNLGGIGRWRD